MFIFCALILSVFLIIASVALFGLVSRTAIGEQSLWQLIFWLYSGVFTLLLMGAIICSMYAFFVVLVFFGNDLSEYLNEYVSIVQSVLPRYISVFFGLLLPLPIVYFYVYGYRLVDI